MPPTDGYTGRFAVRSCHRFVARSSRSISNAISRWKSRSSSDGSRDHPGGGTIVHGYFTLSLHPVLLYSAIEVTGFKMGVNYGLNKVRFTAPVPVGKRIRSRTTLLAVEEIGDRAVQTTNQVLIEVEGGDKPACIAETLGRTYF